MIVTAEPVLLELPSSGPRSLGVHQSSIIRCIATEAGLLKPEWAEELSLTDSKNIVDPVAVLRIWIGLAWDEFYVPRIPEVVAHPGEIHIDGIYCSPDAESMDVIVTPTRLEVRHVIHEVKATYKSTKTVGDLTGAKEQARNWMWLAQLRAYCMASNTRFAKLHVLFLCGDYSYPIRPLLKVFNIEFTQDELFHNWALMRDYMQYRMALEDK